MTLIFPSISDRFFFFLYFCFTKFISLFFLVFLFYFIDKIYPEFHFLKKFYACLWENYFIEFFIASYFFGSLKVVGLSVVKEKFNYQENDNKNFPIYHENQIISNSLSKISQNVKCSGKTKSLENS
jgi:hypothetical protein